MAVKATSSRIAPGSGTPNKNATRTSSKVALVTRPVSGRLGSNSKKK